MLFFTRLTRHHDPRFLALICVCLCGMGQGVVAPKLPELLAHSNRLALSSGLSATMMYLGIFISTYRYGTLADRGLVHRLMGWGLFAYAISLLLMGQTHSEILLLAIRLLEGLAISAVLVGADFILGRVSPEETRGQWLSYYGVALSVGLLAGPLLNLTTNHLSQSLAAVAAIAVFLGVFSLVLIQVPATDFENTLPPPPAGRGPLACGASYGFMEAGLVAVFPVLAVTQFHVLPEKSLMVCIVAAALSSVGWGIATDRWGARPTLRLLFSGLFLLPLALAALHLQGEGAAFLLCALFGVLAGGIYPTGFTWMLQGVPQAHYGFASGAFARAYGLGSLVGPLVTGASTYYFGATGFLLTLSALGAVTLQLTSSRELQILGKQENLT
ncbi:MFS transporter [Bdellovibrionota bacterium FG-1]